MTRRLPSPAKMAGLILGVIIAALLVGLIAAPKPWEAPGPPRSIISFARVYLWWAGALNLIPLTLLALTARWWTRSLPSLPHVFRPLPRGFAPIVLGAMAVFAICGAFRLNHNLWDDEEYSVRRAILGVYKIKNDGTVKLRELPWTDTFWYYTKPTNHVFQSILARISLNTWRAIAKPKGLQLNEAAVRLPTYLAGIGAIGAVALLLGRIGFPRAGMLAAWLLALHPWHLRLAPEARGYGLVFLFIPLVCLAAVHAIETGKWRWWIALGAAEFGLLYSWPTSAMVVIVVNLCLFVQILLRRELQGVRLIIFGRWLASGLMAAMVTFQLLLPCIPQFIAYQQKTMGFSPLGYWLKNVGSCLLAGGLWSKSGLNPTPYLELRNPALDHPIVTGIAIGLATLLLVTGVITMVWRRSPARWMVVVFLLPGFLLTGVAFMHKEHLYEWYLAFMLSGLIALVSVGFFTIGDWIARRTSQRWLPAAAAIVLLAGFFLISHQPRSFLLSRPVQPYVASVLATRPSLDPNSRENRQIMTASSMVSPEVYDPRVQKARTVEDFTELIAEAENTGLPLYINNGFPAAFRENNPGLYELLTQSGGFELVGVFHASEEMLDRVVYRYKPGALKGVNLSRYDRPTLRKFEY